VRKLPPLRVAADRKRHNVVKVKGHAGGHRATAEWTRSRPVALKVGKLPLTFADVLGAVTSLGSVRPASVSCSL
jgi:hypothetical protein